MRVVYQRIDGLHMTYLFWSLCASHQFFRGKKLENKKQKQKSKNEKQPLLLLLFLCDLNKLPLL